MEILPVIDLKGGRVVHGKSGRREHYRPIRSVLAPGNDPIEIAEAFKAHFGFTQFYLADLDAIAGLARQTEACGGLIKRGYQIWLDAGVRSARSALELAQAGIADIIVGLETLPGPQLLSEIIKTIGSARVLFSLDLKRGRPLANETSWPSTDPFQMVQVIVEMGIRRLLVLDLARVGIHLGTGTLELCREIANHYPEIELAAGGGVGGLTDLTELEQAGVDLALVASALHDGRLRPEQLGRFQGED